jgi:3-oxoacyl-[acyl-carrier-protein] synthase III
MAISVGIHGLGTYLPSEIRRNDWWPKDIVARWRTGAAPQQDPFADAEGRLVTEGMRRVAAAIAASCSDPFRGACERRVMPSEMRSTDMEIAAARDALSRSRIDPQQIGLVLTHTTVPDYLETNGACTVHHALGLARSCIALSVEAACNSFHLQLAIAEKMIQAGAVQYALLVQSCSVSRLLPYDKAYSAWFGDGATAVVVGPVSSGRGVCGQAHRCDGALNNTLVAGVPGARWHDTGRVELYSENIAAAQHVFLTVADAGEEVVAEALDAAGLTRSAIDFYASHQGASWLREVTQRHMRLDRAKSVDTFAWTGSLFGANVPLVLALGEREGMIADDSIVLTYAGGSGITWSSFVLKWGR